MNSRLLPVFGLSKDGNPFNREIKIPITKMSCPKQFPSNDVYPARQITKRNSWIHLNRYQCAFCIRSTKKNNQRPVPAVEFCFVGKP
jgi:hypothetical protein